MLTLADLLQRDNKVVCFHKDYVRKKEVKKGKGGSIS